MKIDRIDRATLAPYLPIKDATSHLAWLCCYALVAIVGFVLTLMNLGQLAASPLVFAGPFMVVGGMVGVACLAVVTLWGHPECDGSAFKWMRHFVDRNVYGYRLWCCVDESGTTSYELLSIRNEILKFSPSAEPLIAIGIATNDFEPCLTRYRGATFDIPLQRVRKAGIFPEQETAHVRLHDIDGDVVTFEIRDLLAILRERFLEPDRFIGGTNTHHFLVKGLIEGNRQLGIVRTALHAERLERDKAVRDLDEAARRIDATKRFIRSTEAAGIRAWLGERFAAHEAVRPVVLPGQIDC